MNNERDILLHYFERLASINSVRDSVGSDDWCRYSQVYSYCYPQRVIDALNDAPNKGGINNGGEA